MNETLRTIAARRSVRAYRPEQIGPEELQAILEAGRFAPSGMGQQAWHFSVVQRKELLDRINEACREGFLRSGNKVFEERARAEGFSVFYGAPTLIVVSGDEQALTTVENCALALGNMFLAAASLGVGSCWIHAVKFIFDGADGKALAAELALPPGYRVYASGAFGYPAAGLPDAAPRREGTVTIIR
ncbi:nitroreductase family protein [Anaeroselena agilis]|uniref:Nitroreductase n=1 Tax=Anaeroselena agilis TaxID=3063788 RepID=A0ABU3NZ55_9FIRM|nr:nitroreductase [Selenomonadales bacterium 4137-cl]